MKKQQLKKTIMGIDIGGTKIACALVSSGKLASPVYTARTPRGEKILSVVSKFYEQFSRKYLISGVGISTAGMVSDHGRIVGSTGNIPGWQGTKVKEILQKKYRLPVVVENDANAAAYAEYQIGSARGANPLLMITLGTGVGGGVVVNGRLVRGAHFAGGEIGHIKLSYTKQRRCTCGRYDCLEAYASGNGLLALIKHYFPDKYKKISTRDLFRLARLKNKSSIFAIRAVEDWHFYIALGICNLFQVFDPEKIVLSGGLSEEVNINYLVKETGKLLLPALSKSVRIEKSRLGNNAGLLGAALLASQSL
ncbi:MAG: ROK family protein [Candidatus Melainabacteria bacterium]|nr:ROK family protein [Candidatus Melainabacteria bacterium]